MSSTAETVLECSVPYTALDQTLDTLRTLVHEAIFHISDEGLKVTCVDSANVAMHDLHLTETAFDMTPSGQYAIGVNLEALQDAISKADSDQSISLSFGPQNRMLRLEYAAFTRNMASIDPDSIRKEPDLPDLDLDNEFALTVSDWMDGVEVVDFVSDHIEIHARPDEECVRLFAEGDTDDQTVEWGPETLTDATLRDDTEAMFSMEYMKNVGKGMPDGEVRVVTGDEFPVELHYDIAGGDGHVQTNIAPRISKK